MAAVAVRKRETTILRHRGAMLVGLSPSLKEPAVAEFLPYVAGVLLVLIWVRVEMIAKHVAVIQEDIAKTTRAFGLSAPLSAEPSERVKQMAADPRKTIEALKTYRQESGADIRQALLILKRLRAPHSDA